MSNVHHSVPKLRRQVQLDMSPQLFNSAMATVTPTTITTTIHHLPNEMLQMVLTNLSIAPDLLHHRAVCRHWNQVIECICAQQRSLALDLSVRTRKRTTDVSQLSLYQLDLTTTSHDDFVQITLNETKFPGPSVLFATLGRLFPRIDQLVLSITFGSHKLVVECLAVVRRLWGRQSLHTLVLSTSSYPIASETQRAILCQLVQLPRLKRLALHQILSYYPPTEFLAQLEFFSFVKSFILYGDGEELFKSEGLRLGAHCTGLNLSISSFDDPLKLAFFRSTLYPPPIVSASHQFSFAAITHLGLGVIDETTASGVTRFIRRTFPSLRVLRLEFEIDSLLDQAAFHDLAQLSSLTTLSLMNAECCGKSVDGGGGGGWTSVSLPSVRMLHLKDVFVRDDRFEGFHPPGFVTNNDHSASVMGRMVAAMFPRLEEVRLQYEYHHAIRSHSGFEHSLVNQFRRKQMFPHLKRGIKVGPYGRVEGRFLG